MVLEVKSICCVESLRKIPEIFGLVKGKLCVFNPVREREKKLCDVLFDGIDFDCINLAMNFQIAIG